jgi:hypothetical protein
VYHIQAISQAHRARAAIFILRGAQPGVGGWDETNLRFFCLETCAKAEFMVKYIK